MRALAESRAVALLLAGTCVALGVAIHDQFIEIDAPGAASGERAGGAAAIAPPAPLAKAPPFPAISAFADMIERPLFDATRRPPVATVSTPQAAEVPELAVMLVGIVISDGMRLVALRLGQESRVLALAEGEAVEGWRIERIRSDRVTLRNGERVAEVLFDEPPPTGAATERGAPQRAAVPPRDAGDILMPSRRLADPPERPDQHN